MPEFESFTKALRAYFEMDGTTTIKEYKELSEADKVEYSKMLNDAGFKHNPYTPKQ
jgi:hypothetical protein